MKPTRTRATVGVALSLFFILVFLGTSACNGGPLNPVLLTHSIPGEGGTIQLSPLYDRDGRYAPGTRVTLEARSNEGFSFVRWSGDVQGPLPFVVVTMDRDKSVTAEFRRNGPPAPTLVPSPATAPTNPVPTAAQPSPPPTVTITPDVTTKLSTPEYLGLLHNQGNNNRGIQISIPKSGNYRFMYKDGAYSVYPTGQAPPNTPPWLTAVFIFKGNLVIWNGENIGEPFLRVADTHYSYTQAEAIKKAQGEITDSHFNQGETLTLVGVDSQSAYKDNIGYVDLDWFFLGP